MSDTRGHGDKSTAGGVDGVDEPAISNPKGGEEASAIGGFRLIERGLRLSTIIF